MKPRSYLAAAIAAVALVTVGCENGTDENGTDAAAENGGAQMQLNSLEDRISYMFGYNAGQQLKAQGIEPNGEAVAQAVQDGYSGSEPQLSQEQIQATMQEYQQKLATMQEEEQAKQQAASEENKKKGEEFLAQNAKKEGVVTLPSGLQYKQIEAGQGEQPDDNDTVTVHYRGTLIDGTVFDSSYDRGEPVSFPLQRVIPGWTEGLQHMKVGSKYELYIPSDLAYGPGGSPPKIGPNETLIFQVELLDVKDGEEQAGQQQGGQQGGQQEQQQEQGTAQ